MVLPGISGSYLLLLLGLYLPYLDAMDGVRAALASGLRPAEVLAAGLRAAPFFLGVVFGVAAAARLVRHFLARRRQPTLGVLLGLLVDPRNRNVHIYRGGDEVDLRREPETVDCGPEMPGLVLDFTSIWPLFDD